MFKDFLGQKDVWYIVDTREPMEYRAKTILICSPQKIYYKMFDTLGIDVRFMPVWSPAEIDICRNNIDIFKHLTAEEVQDLYYKWGGVPRFVLLHAHNCTMQMQLDIAINEVEKNIMHFVGKVMNLFIFVQMYQTKKRQKKMIRHKIYKIRGRRKKQL